MLTERQQKLAAICASYQSMSIDAAEMESLMKACLYDDFPVCCQFTRRLTGEECDAIISAAESTGCDSRRKIAFCDIADLKAVMLPTVGGEKVFKILEPVEQTTYVDQRPVTHVETAVPSQPTVIQNPLRAEYWQRAYSAVNLDEMRELIRKTDAIMQEAAQTSKEFVPDSLKVRVGSMEIDSKGTAICGPAVVIDGKQCEFTVKSLDIHMETGSVPVVKMEVIPFPERKPS